MDWSTYIGDLNIPKNWECTSYANDALPSYQVKGYHIWIDSHDMNERLKNSKDIHGTDKAHPRFCIMNADIYNGVMDYPDNYKDLFQTNNFEEVKKFVEGKEI